jgi:hypothetical protein
VQLVHIAIDTQSRAAIMPFWRVVLGYDPVGDEDLVDPFGRDPSFWFQQMAEPREQRNPIHIDISLPATGLTRGWGGPRTATPHPGPPALIAAPTPFRSGP